MDEEFSLSLEEQVDFPLPTPSVRNQPNKYIKNETPRHLPLRRAAMFRVYISEIATLVSKETKNKLLE